MTCTVLAAAVPLGSLLQIPGLGGSEWRQNPLESLAVMLSAGLGVCLSMGVNDPVPWASTLHRGRAALSRATQGVLCMLFGALLCGGAELALPGQHPHGHVLAVVTWCAGVCWMGRSLAGPAVGLVAGLLPVLLCSVAGIVPMEANLFYAPELHGALLVAGPMLLAVGFLVIVRWGDAATRRTPEERQSWLT